MKELAARYPVYGCQMIHDMIRNESLEPINHKRSERIYHEEKLSLRLRRKNKKFRHLRVALEVSKIKDEVWSMDFIFDWLGTNQKLKVLTMLDHHSRTLPNLHAGTSIKGVDVVENPVALKGIMGHSEMRMTERYAKTTDRMAIAGMQASGTLLARRKPENA